MCHSQEGDRRHTGAPPPTPGGPVARLMPPPPSWVGRGCRAGACLSSCREFATAPPSSPRCQEPPTMTARETPANDDTPPPVRIQTPANDDRNRRHTLYNIYSERQPPPCWLPSLHDRQTPAAPLSADIKRKHPPPVVYICRYLQENDKYICKRILKWQIYY